MSAIEEARQRLKEWGYWMRRAPDLPAGLGYPSASPGAELAGNPITRRPEEMRRVERLEKAARRAYTRVVTRDTIQGPRQVREAVQHMIPHSQPKGKRAPRPTSDRDGWPESAREVNSAVARLTRREQEVLYTRYWLQLSRRKAAKTLMMAEPAYREVLNQAEGQVAGILMSGVDVGRPDL